VTVTIDFDGAPMRDLLDLLQSGMPRQRADAACAIGDRLRARELAGLEDEERRVLVALLDDEAFGVRFEAAMALAEAREPKATPLLLEALHSRRLRLDATRALGTLGDAAAVEPLHRILHRWLMPWADKLQAAAALCALGDAEGIVYLESKLGSRRHAERAAAIHFIGESRHPEARRHLEALLVAAHEPMRDVAARALGLLGDPAARPALEAALEGAGDELTEDIQTALAQLSR